jgi:hypothetical protein
MAEIRESWAAPKPLPSAPGMTIPDSADEVEETLNLCASTTRWAWRW